MKKLTKSMICIACAALFTTAFAACGDDTPKPPEGGGENPPATETNPSVVGESHGYYFAASPQSLAFNMYMNGGTFESLKVNGTELTRNQEYKFNIGTEILTINESYLATLATGDYTFTFTTNKGSCQILVSVGGSELIEGYNMQFGKSETDSVPDHFFAKAGRDEDSVKFDFLTFGDFTTEGASLKFINLLIDKAPFDDTGLNWRLNAEDMNVRLYSDGEVIYRKNFTGTEMKNGVANGLDNIWWKTNRNNPNYETAGFEKVSITRQGGVTSFSLELSYDFLGIESTEGFRFAVMECSDASSYDFNLYANGIVELDGVALGNPVKLADWPMLDGEGNVVRPEDIEVEEPEVPSGYDLAFAKAKDRMYSKFSLATDGSGILFDFWTGGDFGVNGLGQRDFVNLYFDMPAFNKNGKNWCLEQEDVNVRIYSDGTIYKRTGFDGGRADNVWYPRSQLSDDNKLAQQATIVKNAKTGTSISALLTWEQLGTTKETFKGLRFWLAECTDNNDNFDYAGADLTYKNESVGVDALLPTWPMFTAEGNVVLAKDIVAEGVPEGYDLSFAAAQDGIYSKVSYDAAKGVTFDFWTDGDFGMNGTGLEFVQIYLDMPALNTEFKGNWRFDADDLVIRIYSNGEVYFLKNFDDTADNLWVKLNRGDNPTVNKRNDGNTPPTATKANNIVINKTNGKTAFSLTVTLEELGVAAGETIDNFRFYLAECAENDGPDFNFYGSTLSYKGKAFGDAANCNNFAKFTLATNSIYFPEAEGYTLSFAAGHDKFYSKMSYDAATGVKFDFLTEGNFDKDGDTALEFVQIYLDMPAFNAFTGDNWKFNSNEDIIIRIYSDGNVYFIRQFADRADNVWIKLDHSAVTADKTVAIDRANGKTTFSLTLTLEELGIASGGTLESFRFLMAECSDNSPNDFNLYDGADMTYGGKKVNGGHSCDNWATFTLATNGIALP